MSDTDNKKEFSSEYLTPLDLDAFMALNLQLFGQEDTVERSSEKSVAPPSVEKRMVSSLPTGPAADLIYSTLIGGSSNMDRLPDIKEATSKSVTMKYSESGKMRKLSYTKSKGKNLEDKIELSIVDINLLCGSNKSAKKIFNLILQKANEQALASGVLIKDTVTFPLKDLIDLGIYSRPQSARNGFKDAMDILTGIKVMGSSTTCGAKGRKHKVDALAVLFPTSHIRNGICSVRLNSDLDWGFITPFFTCIPRYYYGLNNSAADLLYYIFYLARQNAKEIAEKGYFTISYAAIHGKLCLPDPASCPNPQRDIKDRISNAIEDIEKAHWNTCNNKDLQLSPICNEDAPIKEFLAKGKLKVTLKNDFAENFVRIGSKQKKMIEAQEKKNARIAERASAIHLEKKMAAEEQGQK